MISSGGNWLLGSRQTGDGFADAFNQLPQHARVSSCPLRILFGFATVQLVAMAPGNVVVTWDTAPATELDFFGLTNAPPTSFSIGGTATPPFLAMPNIPHPLLSGPSLAGAAADFDRDGDDDLIAKGNTNRTLAWYEYDRSSGTFAEHLIATLAGTSNIFSNAGDLDGDGDPDVFVSNQSTGRSAGTENDAGGTSWTAWRGRHRHVADHRQLRRRRRRRRRSTS